MTKQVYRGVESDSADKPENDHHHGEGLVYRGSPMDGEQAEKDAEAAPSEHKHVYRGVEEDADGAEKK